MTDPKKSVVWTDKEHLEHLISELKYNKEEVLSLKQRLVELVKREPQIIFDLLYDLHPDLKEEKIFGPSSAKVSDEHGTPDVPKTKTKPKKKAKLKAKQPPGIKQVKEGSRSHEILMAMERVGRDCKAAEVLEHTNGLAETANGLSSVRNYLLQLAKGGTPWVERVGLGTYRLTDRATTHLGILSKS